MKRILFGIVVVVLGFVLMLSSLNVANVSTLLGQWWPLFLVAIGLIQLVDRSRGNWWPYILVLIGLGMLLKTTATLDFDFWQFFWPAIIIVAGLGLIFGNRGMKTRHKSEKSDEDIVAILSGAENSNISDDYTRSSVIAIMGGVELDLSKATIKSEAHIELSVVMGGVELRVPEHVAVKSRATCLLGGIEDKARPTASKKEAVLYLDGFVLMGGIEIKR